MTPTPCPKCQTMLTHGTEHSCRRYMVDHGRIHDLRLGIHMRTAPEKDYEPGDEQQACVDVLNKYEDELVACEDALRAGLEWKDEADQLSAQLTAERAKVEGAIRLAEELLDELELEDASDAAERSYGRNVEAALRANAIITRRGFNWTGADWTAVRAALEKLRAR